MVYGNKNVNNDELSETKASQTPNSTHVDEDSWREVKRKSKEGKAKKDTKKEEPKIEREELEFHFDEDLDENVPLGRQNTFTTEW